MTAQEYGWLHICSNNPKEYRIDVDNDSVFVTDTSIEECVFEFDSFGWQMVVELLRYIGCNAGEV